jgi:hypothetical protein
MAQRAPADLSHSGGCAIARGNFTSGRSAKIEDRSLKIAILDPPSSILDDYPGAKFFSALLWQFLQQPAIAFHGLAHMKALLHVPKFRGQVVDHWHLQILFK